MYKMDGQEGRLRSNTQRSVRIYYSNAVEVQRTERIMWVL